MKKINIITILTLLLISFGVLAQPGVTVGNVNAIVGGVATVPVNYLGTVVGSPSGVVGFQARFNYDNTKVQPTATGLDACNNLAIANITCTDDGSSINIVGFTFPLAEIASAVFNIDFDLQAGAINADVIALNIISGPVTAANPDGEEYKDFGNITIPSVGTSDGSITVVNGPQPDWSSAPVGGSSLTFPTVIAGGTAPTQLVAVNNAGAALSTLTGTCALSVATDPELTISSGAAVSLAQNASSNVNLSCDATAAGTFTGSLDCTHNGDGTTEASPVSYPLTCTIAPPGQAQYVSTPVDGATIEMTTGLGVPVGATAPTTSIAISNPAPNLADNDLDLVGCTYAGSAEITVTSTDPLTTALAAQSAATATVDFSCATGVTGNFTGTYTCPYSTDGDTTAQENTASYTVNCDVRAAAATGSQSPPDMTTINFVAPPGGSVSSSVTFSEVGGEGVDITDLNCSVTGPDFVITSPGAFPATVLAAGSLPVVVTFTDSVAGPFSDTLTCTYSDATGDVSVSYPLSGTAQAIVVPTLSWIGYTAMMLGLLFVGFIGFRRRA